MLQINFQAVGVKIDVVAFESVVVGHGLTCGKPVTFLPVQTEVLNAKIVFTSDVKQHHAEGFVYAQVGELFNALAMLNQGEFGCVRVLP